MVLAIAYRFLAIHLLELIVNHSEDCVILVGLSTVRRRPENGD